MIEFRALVSLFYCFLISVISFCRNKADWSDLEDGGDLVEVVMNFEDLSTKVDGI